MNTDTPPAQKTNSSKNTRKDYQWLHVARVTIEFVAPFHIGSGRDGEGIDALIIRDANGLPAIPGTSIAGVLRRRMPDDGKRKEIFGHQHRDEGRGSRLSITWGCIHDTYNLPVDGILSVPADDKVLANARGLTIRDHVRIGRLGTGDGAGKFDNEKVCAGHRFTFELELWDTAQESEDWQTVLDAVRGPGLRFGAKTRGGFGLCQVEAVHVYAFNLGDEKDFEKYCQHPVSLRDESTLEEIAEAETKRSDSLVIDLALKPRNYWMFGGGDDLDDLPGDADMAPVRDNRIDWSNGNGEVLEDIPVVPGSSMKGAIAHRTAFHWNLRQGNYANGKSPEEIEKLANGENKCVRALFGHAKGRNEGSAGRIFIDDIFIPNAPGQVFATHNSIDRFTQGTREGALFSERPFACDPQAETPWHFPLRIEVDRENGLDPDHLRALMDAIEDIAESRLPLGGGTGRGLGFCEADLKWPTEWETAATHTSKETPESKS